MLVACRHVLSSHDFLKPAWNDFVFSLIGLLQPAQCSETLDPAFHKEMINKLVSACLSILQQYWEALCASCIADTLLGEKKPKYRQAKAISGEGETWSFSAGANRRKVFCSLPWAAFHTRNFVLETLPVPYLWLWTLQAWHMRTWAPQLLLTGCWSKLYCLVWDHHNLVLLGTDIASLLCKTRATRPQGDRNLLLRIIMTIRRVAKCETRATLGVTENRALLPLNPMLYHCKLFPIHVNLAHNWWDTPCLPASPMDRGGSWWWCGGSPVLQL